MKAADLSSPMLWSNFMREAMTGTATNARLGPLDVQHAAKIADMSMAEFLARFEWHPGSKGQSASGWKARGAQEPPEKDLT